MTTEHEASRTLVKSPPELWAECSDAGSLARHLGEFGEITITRLEPETTVVWEGANASGTVRIEPSGWGTRVTLTAQTDEEPEEIADEEPALATPEEPEPEETEPPATQEVSDATVEETLADPEPEPAAEVGRFRLRWRRLSARWRGPSESAGELEAEAVSGASEPEAEDDGASEPEAEVVEETGGSVPPPEAGADAQPDLVAEDADPVPEPAGEDAVLASEALAEPPEPQGPRIDPEPGLDAPAILASALASLGQAHHRPFSRA